MDFKNVKLIQNKKIVKDPPRFPAIINSYELQSKKDFNSSLIMTGKQVLKQMEEFIK